MKPIPIFVRSVALSLALGAGLPSRCLALRNQGSDSGLVLGGLEEALPEKGRIRRDLIQALRDHPGGPIILDELAESLHAKPRTLYHYLSATGLLAEENARRTAQEPVLQPIQLIGSRAADTVGRIVAALQGYPGGTLSANRLSALAGVDLFTLKTYHAGALVLQENARRADQGPPREAILFIDLPSMDPIKSLTRRNQRVLARRYDRLVRARDYLVAWLALVRVLQRLPYTGELYWALTRVVRPTTERGVGYVVFNVRRITLAQNFERWGLIGWLGVIPHRYQKRDPDSKTQEQLPQAVSQARQDLERLPRTLAKPARPPVPWHVLLDRLDSQTQMEWLTIVQALTARQLDVLVYCLACQERYGSWPTKAEVAKALGFNRERARQLYNKILQRFSPLEARAGELIPSPRMRARTRTLVLENLEQVRQELARRLEALPREQETRREEPAALGALLEALRNHPGGPTTAGELAAFAGVPVYTLQYRRYRSLVAEENARRQDQQDPRPEIQITRKRKSARPRAPAPIVRKRRGGKSRLADIVKVLGKHPGGELTIEELASLAGVGTRTLYTHRVHPLIAEENARRAGGGIPLIELVERPRPSSLPRLVEVLRNHPRGLLTRRELLGLVGIAESSLDRYPYRSLIEEENARRVAEEGGGRPAIRLVTEYEKRAIVAIAGALREHPGGRLTLQQLSDLSVMSHSGLLAYDYHTLLAEENARRAAEEPDRPPIWMTRRVTGTLALITSALRNHPGGPVTAVELGRLAGVGVHNLYVQGWRGLIAEENALRGTEEPRRPALVVAEYRTPWTLPVVTAALRRHPGGRLTLTELEAFSTVSMGTLLRLDYRGLMAQENARRTAEEPSRLPIAIPPKRSQDPLEAVVTALHQHPGGPLTVDELLTLVDIGLTTLYRINVPALLAEENASRKEEDPPRGPVVLVGPGPPRALVAMARALREHPGGRLTQEELAELADISKYTVGYYDYRALVVQENAQRALEGRTLIELAKDEAEVETAIVAALRKHPGGPLTAKGLAQSATVSEGSLSSHDYRALIALENERRAAEEPDRPSIVISEPPREKDALVAAILTALRGHPGGQLTANELVALADVYLSTLERFDYEGLIAQENARRAAEEPPRPAIELFVPPERPALERIVAFLRAHPGGPLTVGELAQQAFVSRATLTWNHYRALVAQENASRQREEPPRRPIEIVRAAPPQTSGLEEAAEGESALLAYLAEAVQGPGVLIIGPEALEARAGLEELARRASPALLRRMVFFGVGTAWANRLREVRSDAQIVEGHDLVELAAILLAIPEADRVTVLGSFALARQLRQIVPASMSVTSLDLQVAFRFLLAALGVPDSALVQVNAAGLEEQLARSRAA